MADRAHEITDRIIKSTEERLRQEYEQAAAELEEKLNDHFRRYRIKDEKWRQWVKDGKRTEKEYQQWRKGQLAVGKRWSQMKDTIAEDLNHVNEIARDICAGQQVDIYAINHAFGTYQIEHDAGINTSYTLYNHEAVENILANDPELLPPPGIRVSKAIAEGKATRWARQKIQSTMLQGILQGDSIPELAKRLATNVSDSNYKAAVRNARTMATSAQNAGRYGSYRRAKGMGIDLTIEWAAVLDNRTRHSHRQMHGQRREVDEPFTITDGGRTFNIMWPADCNSSQSNAPQREIWNCFVGETNVASDSEIVRSYKHEYSGELITVKTAGGVNFTCTPNHPILTTFGWIPAARLHEGDDLLVTSISDNAVFPDGNVNQTHPTFETIHKTFSELGTVDQRSMSDFNFHGDIPTSDVEVVSKKRLLRGCFDTGISEGINELLFKSTNPLVTCKRHFMAGFRRVYISTLRLMSRLRKALTLFWGRLRHSDVHGLGSVTGGNTGIPQNTVNNLSAMSNVGGECLDGLAGKVFADNIVSVNRHTGRHPLHVYNLQTKNGYYFVNNIIDQSGQKSNGNYAIAHNCRCTLLSWVKGFEHDMQTDSDKMTMSFDEWLQIEPGKEEFLPILSQYEKGQAIKMQYIREYKYG